MKPTSQPFKMVLAALLASTIVTGCGKDDKKSGGRDSDDAKGDTDGEVPGADVPTEVKDGGDVDTTNTGDGNPLPGETGENAFSLRLLKPEELEQKTKDIFGKEWMVTISQPSETNPNGTVTMSGFKAFAGNLNGIDYNSNNQYSEVGSAIYISTHEKFCDALVTQTFADAATRATFFPSAPETATLASDRMGVEANIAAATIRLFGRDMSDDAGIWAEIVGLYADLEATSAADRVNRSPMQLTVQALCFSDPFVHTF